MLCIRFHYISRVKQLFAPRSNCIQSWTNQHWAMRLTFLAQWNNGILWKGSELRDISRLQVRWTNHCAWRHV